MHGADLGYMCLNLHLSEPAKSKTLKRPKSWPIIKDS